MNRQVLVIAGSVAAGVLLAAGVAIALSGGGDDTSVTTDTTPTSVAPVGGSGGGSGSSGGGSGSSGGGGQQSGGGGQQSGGGSNGGSGNQSPIIRDVQPFAEFGGENCDNKPFLDLEGHAYDPDGPNDQNVNRVEVNWGDGKSTTITTFANNAFSSLHCYDSSYGGQSVSVHVKAVDDSGATAEQSVSVPLPAA